MENILLVEPEYKNKFPPLGLMKIATYHRNKGDIVEFFKGKAPYNKIITKDRIYITTLFTFHYELITNCISHYVNHFDKKSIFVGGITATLMASDIEKDTGVKNIIRERLLSSNTLGYKDDVNIDSLPLDYDILDDISYEYPARDNYFVYTTRGCPRGCEFCAVQFLEPEFTNTNNLIEQVKRVDKTYGQKRNMLVMDNNILCSKRLRAIVDDIKSLEFSGKADYIPPNRFDKMIEKIERRKRLEVDYYNQIIKTIDYLEEFSNKIRRYKRIYEEFTKVINNIKNSDNRETALKEKATYLSNIVEKYRSKTKVIRYVDFNQGIDARLINENNIKMLSELPIRPFRLAYDSVKETEKFVNATRIAAANGFEHFSNYVLYNWKDKPGDLWSRLNKTTSLYNEEGMSIKGYSFPMKYSPFNEKDRKYIGEHWNRKYINAVNIIINVTNGVVAKEKDFFYEAFGTNIKEFHEILCMPDEFIRFRHYFRDNGLTEYWRRTYRRLKKNEKEHLINILSRENIGESVADIEDYPVLIKKILVFYTITRTQLEKKGKTVDDVIKEIKSIK